MKQPSGKPTLTGRPPMPASAKGAESGLVNPGRPRMSDSLADSKASGPLSPSQPPPGRPPDETMEDNRADDPGSYLRLRLRLREGALSVEETWTVKGALTEPPVLYGPYVWEVRLGGRRLAMGDLADLGEVRGSFNPADPKGEPGHQIRSVTDAELPIRIPGAWKASQLLQAELFLSIVKVRVAEAQPDARPLHVQWERELRLISYLKGLAPSALPKQPKPRKPKRSAKKPSQKKG